METKKYLSTVYFPFLVCGCINMGSVLGNRRPAGDGNQSLDGFSTDFDQNMKRPIFGEKIFDHPRRNWLRSVCLLFGDDRCSPPAAYYLLLIRGQRLKTNTFIFVSPQPFIKVDLIQGQVMNLRFIQNFRRTGIRVKLFQTFIIGPESDHWQCLSLTDSLTNSLRSFQQT